MLDLEASTVCTKQIHKRKHTRWNIFILVIEIHEIQNSSLTLTCEYIVDSIPSLLFVSNSPSASRAVAATVKRQSQIASRFNWTQEVHTIPSSRDEVYHRYWSEKSAR